MEKPEKHIFVCASYRVTGAPQGVCHKKGSINLLQYLETEIDKAEKELRDLMTAG